MYIQPKAGRLASGAYGDDPFYSPIRGEVFPKETRPDVRPATVGGLKMPDNRALTIYGHPLSSLRSVSQQTNLAPLNTIDNNTRFVSPQNNPLVMPHEHGSFFHRKPTAIDKTQFGATGQKDSDTSFHPKRKVIYAPPVQRSAIAGERTSAASFATRGNNWYDPNNSFVSGASAPGSATQGTGRWNTTKRGVV